MALVVHGKDRKAMPDLIGLLGDLPQGSAWRVEDVLVRLAGDQAPSIAVGTDGASRSRSRDAWLAWWQENSARVDLTKLDEQPITLGLTLVVLLDPRGIAGQVLEVNANKDVQWRITNLQYPVDAVVVAKDRVVIFEQQNRLLSERDFSGKVIWSQQTNAPSGVQRLPNGHLLVACRDQLRELDAKQNTAWTYNRNPPDILAARRSRNGDTVFLTNTGACIRLDAKGTQIETVPMNRTPNGDLDVLANGRILVTQTNSVNEIDANGKSVWSANVARPTSLQRLPNGNTLVVGQPAGIGGNPVVLELDRAGKTVWEFRSPDGSTVWRARRR
jgi:outer membrane protein assembly factor BamB